MTAGGDTTLKPLSNTQCFNQTLGEIRDASGQWHTGWLTFGRLAELIGTPTADLMRRFVALSVVERRGGRHSLTSEAINRSYGMTYHRHRKGIPRLSIDVILPDGMALLVQNLEATNLPSTEAEKLSATGLSLSAIAARLGCSKQAVHKRLRSLPPRLVNWPVSGSWEGCDVDNGNSVNVPACAA